ncbi:YeiH family protein [Gulosibacter chungangensis]|uniref:Putative sulfate exporter family transporter n=1 Tax=Gulosibacter chungangensis TaxID=979746 RepID=A0A7J5BA64_9MICO|nr:putative sulfate exporter family transporter [Gulosibacter chungangensis]KAB1642736.1 putative sulfate exporter family transporter [Gulosibacter chungangensis]
MAPQSQTESAGATTKPQEGGAGWWTVAGLLLVVALAIVVQVLTSNMPDWTAETWFGPLAKSVEFPVYAIAIGFAFNGILSLAKVRDRMSAGFRTEFFIKIGLVLLGTTVNVNVILDLGLPAVIQALLLITVVFFFTWWFAGIVGLAPHLRALLATALSICGVSAAVAAAGAVHAKKEQLAYVAGLVIVFALPAIFLLPWLAQVMGLSPVVTGAWIGGNIDTTAAVTAAGAMASEEVLQYASVVKMIQNALIGFVAVALSIYFTLKVDRPADAVSSKVVAKAGWGQVWQRFPKFVFGFLFASVLVSTLAAIFPAALADGAWLDSGVNAAKSLQTMFFTVAFVSIGLEFRFGALKEAGWKPILVFFAGTVMNLVAGLLLSWLLFGVLFAGNFS